MGKQGEGTPDETGYSFQLKNLIRSKIDLWVIADRLNVNRSTLQKILDGRPVSRSILKKIAAAFQTEEVSAERRGHPSNRLSIEKLMTVYYLYEEERSLRLAGEKLGLSRERVRQILEKGSELGLFEYAPPRPPSPGSDFEESMEYPE